MKIRLYRSRETLIAILFVLVMLIIYPRIGYPQVDEMGNETNISNVTLEGNAVMIDVLDLKNIDINDVVKLISQKSGLNIVAAYNVKGRITVYLRNVTAKEALRIIVNSNDWAYYEGDKTITIMLAADFEKKYGYKFGEQINTKIKQLMHVSPTDAMNILNQVKSASGKIIPDDKSHTLVLMDLDDKLDEMEAILKRIDAPIKTEIFALNYATVEDLSPKINEVLTPGLGTLKSDVRSNKLVVSDTAIKMEKITKIIEAFDQKDKEVLIESKIIQVILSNDQKMGVDWESLISDYHSLDLKSTFSILGETDKKGKVSIGTISSDDYTALIEALETVGITDILSSPRIATVSNKEAKILVGSTEPYVTTTTTTPSSGPTTTAESVNFIEVGVKLYVTPTVHNDGFITMKIKPEISSVTKNITTSNNNTIPVVETSEAETTVMAKDGVTVVIGGLIKEEKIKEINRVPLLGKVPVLKYAFQNKSDSVQKTEIVIFLTPTIITGDIEAVHNLLPK